jgi:hypothetical protein
MNNVERSTFQRSTFNVPTFNLQPSTFNLQPSTFNLPTFNLQRLTARSPNRMQTDQVLVLSGA